MLTGDPYANQSNNQWGHVYTNSSYLEAVDEAGTLRVMEMYSRDKSGCNHLALLPPSVPYNFIGRSFSKPVSSDRDINQGHFPPRYYPIPYIDTSDHYKVSVY